MEDKNIIYGLVDPDTFEIRYIGKSTCGIARAKMHGQPAQLRKNINPHKCNWIRRLKRDGKDYGIIILHVASTKEQLINIEIDFISFCKNLGYNLLNQTDGGEGTNGRVVSAQTRKKISDAKRGALITQEHRAKLSFAHGGRSFVDQYGNKYDSIKGAARSLGIAASDICRVLKGTRYYVGGYSFKYL